MQEDVSRIVGEVMIPYGGQDYRLKPFGFDDWSVLQSKFANEKRERILMSVMGLKKKVSHADFLDLRREAINEAGNVSDMTHHDFESLMQSNDGLALLLWVMFEKAYPGKFDRVKCLKMMRDGAITEDIQIAIMQQVQVALGMSPAGNEIGPTETAEISPIPSEMPVAGGI